MLIDELLVVGNDGLRNGLTDGINLGSVSTTSNSNANVDASKFVEANDQDGFVDLESQDLRLDKVERLSVDLNESLACLFTSVSSLIACANHVVCIVVDRTLQWATAVAVETFCQHLSLNHDRKSSIPVFFLPKHCTLCDDAMNAIGVTQRVSLR